MQVKSAPAKLSKAEKAKAEAEKAEEKAKADAEKAEEDAKAAAEKAEAKVRSVLVVFTSFSVNLRMYLDDSPSLTVDRALSRLDGSRPDLLDTNP